MNFFQPFDQVGYFPSYFMHSKIISYKNLLLYNLYKETKITSEQIQNYYNNGGEGVFFDKSLAERYWNVFYEYFKKRMFSVDLEVLVGYSCETENGPVTLHTHTQCVFHIIRLRLIIFHTPKYFHGRNKIE